MKDSFDLVITEDGKVEAIYQDGLAETLDAKETRVCRVSHVEWEDGGWTVRAMHDPELAIRSTKSGFVGVTNDSSCRIVVFPTRETALKAEVAHFWQLKEQNNG